MIRLTFKREFKDGLTAGWVYVPKGDDFVLLPFTNDTAALDVADGTAEIPFFYRVAGPLGSSLVVKWTAPGGVERTLATVAIRSTDGGERSAGNVGTL